MANHENVMLLSMSILPRTKSINTYKGITEEGQEYYFKGISQLEAHSKYVAKILDDKGEKIDRFVILSTNEANDYNTRSNTMAGKLPVGPICNPGIESISAAVEPQKHDYFYFVADKHKKTYFAKTYNEHVTIINKLKKDGLWYTYE